MNKPIRILHILSLLLLLVSVFILSQGLNININQMSQIEKMRDLASLLKWGVIFFGISLLMYAGLLVFDFSKHRVIGMIGYGLLVYTLFTIFKGIWVVNKVFDCSITFKASCTDAVASYQQFDLGSLNINYGIMILSIGLIIWGYCGPLIFGGTKHVQR